jgi:hypothetical protein
MAMYDSHNGGNQDPGSIFNRGGEGTGNLRNRYNAQNAVNNYNQNGFNSQNANQLYQTYNNTQNQGDRDAIVRLMQGNDQGVGYNNAMRQGGYMLNSGPNGSYTYEGGHQPAPGGPAPLPPMNPYGNRNPYVPGGVTDQVNAMQNRPVPQPNPAIAPLGSNTSSWSSQGPAPARLMNQGDHYATRGHSGSLGNWGGGGWGHGPIRYGHQGNFGGNMMGDGGSLRTPDGGTIDMSGGNMGGGVYN